MDTFGRLPNELFEQIKFCYDQPIDLNQINDDILNRLHHKKKLELNDIETQIELRAMRKTRLFYDEVENIIFIKRYDVYERRHAIMDLFMDAYDNIKVNWNKNDKTTICINCKKSFLCYGSFVLIKQKEAQYIKLIEDFFPIKMQLLSS